jgi:hypothetical protein
MGPMRPWCTPLDCNTYIRTLMISMATPAVVCACPWRTTSTHSNHETCLTYCTQFSLARMVGEQVPGFCNAKGEWPRQLHTMCLDGLAIVVGSTLGESCPKDVVSDHDVQIRHLPRSTFGNPVSIIGEIYIQISPDSACAYLVRLSTYNQTSS